MHKLYITDMNQRSGYGRDPASVPSRFLEELPEEATKKRDRLEKLSLEEKTL